jgi:hypothetical protein
MGALLSGLESALYVGNRLKVYYEYLPKLEDSQAQKNFEDALLKLQAKLLKFLAQAIILHDKKAIARTWIAVWGADEVKSFDIECGKIAKQVEIEASNCDRKISTGILSKLAGLDDVKNSIAEISAEIQLPKLAYADGVRYNSAEEEHRPSCLEDTRIELLDEVYRWAESDQPREPHIFWLAGSAGTGKSTISRTVARFLDNMGLLGASFFFSRDKDLRKHSNRLFTTIASDLVKSFPVIKKRVLDKIREDDQISTMGLTVHFENLILGPCRDCVKDETTIVIVIDALDECEEKADIPKILKLLARAHEVKRERLRIFLTSRLEIVDQMKLEDDIKSTYRLTSLDEIPGTEKDISKYFTNEFAHMEHKPDDPTDWPGRAVVEQLTKMAVPSFIFAATTCRVIGDPDFTPADQLQLILDFPYPELASELDKTYLPVLAQVASGEDKRKNQRLQSQFHKLLGMVVLVADPLSAPALTILMDEKDMSLDIVESRLRGLRSVLRVPNDKQSPVRVFHQSFRDFLIDQDKKDHHWFWVNEQEVHGWIAQKCFILLSKKGTLGRDLCGFGKPGLQRREVQRQFVESKLASQVQYACRFWAYHMGKSTRRPLDKTETQKGTICPLERTEILQFLKEHFLHWIETLGWIGKLSEGVDAIIFLRKLFSVS